MASLVTADWEFDDELSSSLYNPLQETQEVKSNKFLSFLSKARISLITISSETKQYWKGQHRLYDTFEIDSSLCCHRELIGWPVSSTVSLPWSHPLPEGGSDNLAGTQAYRPKYPCTEEHGYSGRTIIINMTLITQFSLSEQQYN